MEDVYMKRAIELAKLGEGYTYPNPLVGAVIVKNGQIIGEGYHEYFGGPHAEINAFNNAIESVEGATMYVTLEPCSHYGKTPPCAKAIVEKGISKVIIGMRDPNELVSGRGIKLLEENGIEVIQGVCSDKVERLNEIFIKYITTKLPFCILKTAMTLDGKISTVTGESKWISSEASREYAHRIRHKVSGIMVGVGTVLQDDPSLTTRLKDSKGRDSARIVVDTRAMIPLEANILNLKSDAKTIIATTDLADSKKIEKLKEKGAEVLIVSSIHKKVDLKELMIQLGKQGIDSILLEGGSELNYSALEAGIVDKIISFIAPKIIGGTGAKTPVGGRGKCKMEDAIYLKNIKVSRIEEDIIVEGYL